VDRKASVLVLTSPFLVSLSCPDVADDRAEAVVNCQDAAGTQAEVVLRVLVVASDKQLGLELERGPALELVFVSRFAFVSHFVDNREIADVALLIADNTLEVVVCAFHLADDPSELAVSVFLLVGNLVTVAQAADTRSDAGRVTCHPVGS
jgi:hypothetical protein